MLKYERHRPIYEQPTAPPRPSSLELPISTRPTSFRWMDPEPGWSAGRRSSASNVRCRRLGVDLGRYVFPGGVPSGTGQVSAFHGLSHVKRGRAGAQQASHVVSIRGAHPSSKRAPIGVDHDYAGIDDQAELARAH